MSQASQATDSVAPKTKTAPNRIREWREKRGLSQRALGDAVNATAGQINKLETGQRRLTDDWLERLARPLDCLPAELLAERFYKPYLSRYERALLTFVRALDDTDQVRLAKAIRAWTEPVRLDEFELVD